MMLDWSDFDLGPLAAELRGTAGPAEAEKTIWAFERAVAAGRIDDDLLDYLLAAVTCLLAARDGCSPRDVLEAFFRRSVPDETWRERYLPLFA